MATTKGTAIASPQIFGSDPIEQIYAKGTLDPTYGGIAYLGMSNARDSRAQAQETYLNALRESNMMAQRLAMYESDQELLGKALTSAAEMANAGIDPNTMPVNARLYGRNFGTEAIAIPSNLSRDLKRAMAAEHSAKAAAAGAEGGVQYQEQQDYGAGGGPGDRRVTFKGKNAAAVQKAADEYYRRQPGVVQRPDGSFGPPLIPQARSQANTTFTQSPTTQRINERDQKYNNR